MTMIIIKEFSFRIHYTIQYNGHYDWLYAHNVRNESAVNSFASSSSSAHCSQKIRYHITLSSVEIGAHTTYSSSIVIVIVLPMPFTFGFYCHSTSIQYFQSIHRYTIIIILLSIFLSFYFGLHFRLSFKHTTPFDTSHREWNCIRGVSVHDG